METVKVEAQSRTATGKGANRRLRNENLIPAVAYGKGKGAEAIVVSPKALAGILTSERGRNSVVELAVDGGESTNALISDYQYHPVSRELLHADFLRIDEDHMVEVDVPLETKGRAKGVVAGGILRIVFRRLPLRCKAKDIPVKITVDISNLEIEQHLAVQDLQLPEGVECRLRAKQTLVSISEDKRKARAEAAAATTDEKKKK